MITPRVLHSPFPGIISNHAIGQKRISILNEELANFSVVAKFATTAADGYEPIDISTSNTFHDRFLVIDNTVYFIGASLKDLGKKLFAFSKMEIKHTELVR